VSGREWIATVERGRGHLQTDSTPVGRSRLTRMMCSPAQLNDHIPKHWEYVRS